MTLEGRCLFFPHCSCSMEIYLKGETAIVPGETRLVARALYVCGGRILPGFAFGI